MGLHTWDWVFSGTRGGGLEAIIHVQTANMSPVQHDKWLVSLHRVELVLGPNYGQAEQVRHQREEQQSHQHSHPRTSSHFCWRWFLVIVYKTWCLICSRLVTLIKLEPVLPQQRTLSEKYAHTFPHSRWLKTSSSMQYDINGCHAMRACAMQRCTCRAPPTPLTKLEFRGNSWLRKALLTVTIDNKLHGEVYYLRLLWPTLQ